ncbi:RED-like domain containing protein [Rhodotorula toruloides]|uniref:RED-like domain containing protein n=1 Tax=Rhodotorula toruloides TaxID=5286 RepID=A0A511KEL5_RHOTO|nr:RED-like domain containing protein [Rhodotorula toruloides]
MDQDAFRHLLATPAHPSSSSTPSSSRSRFGQAPPKRPAPTAADAKELSTDFKPRKTARKPKRAPDGSVYRDRAAERRLGKEGDFAEAEKLLEDFKARSEGIDKDTLETQMKYLGGDAKHSILVKGLDMALLERNKHEQSKKADEELGDVEDELEAALAAAPEPSTSAATAPPATPSIGAKRKTRDELLAELKAMRGGQAASASPPVEKDPRFKPLGAGSGDKKGKGKGAAGAGSEWKAVGGAAGEGEKKKRKKKKVAPAPAPAAAEAQPAKKGPSPPPMPLPPQPAPEDIDDDLDIFGDAGEYKGFDSDDSDDDADLRPTKPAATPPPQVAMSAAKRKYFDDDDEDDPRFSTSTAPNAVTDLAAKQAAADAAAAEAKRSRRTCPGDGDEGDEGEEKEAAMRLEGLSGSGPSVKDLLEMDKAAEVEEKRKAKKAKYQAKAADRRENMTDADKTNQDVQRMMAYLAKKESKKGGKSE